MTNRQLAILQRRALLCAHSCKSSLAAHPDWDTFDAPIESPTFPCAWTTLYISNKDVATLPIGRLADLIVTKAKDPGLRQMWIIDESR